MPASTPSDRSDMSKPSNPSIPSGACHHEDFMRQALALAERGRGWVSPNPMVGALVVQGSQIAGQGWHKQFGGPHAEVHALADAGAKTAGATLYCTLEPCAHTGKTPPCVDAIVRAGIKTVVLGARDINPVASGGAERLRAAGVALVTGVLEPECRALNAAFFKRVESGRPLVSLKWAMSADGKLATASGDSQWITGKEARAYAHRLRAEHDAVLIGIGTLLKDRARLTCRIERPPGADPLKPPRRVILDSCARTPLDAPLWASTQGPVTLFCHVSAPAERVAALREKGAVVVSLDGPEGRPPLTAVLNALLELGTLSVLVEGGSHVLGAFRDQHLVDRVYAFVGPCLIGGRGSIPAVGGEGAKVLADALRLGDLQVMKLGADILLTATVG